MILINLSEDILRTRRDDYVCMEPDGRTTAILNHQDKPKDVGQIKFSEHRDRANHRFADVSGLLHQHKEWSLTSLGQW